MDRVLLDYNNSKQIYYAEIVVRTDTWTDGRIQLNVSPPQIRGKSVSNAYHPYCK